jgi:flagellar biosynthesis/type III secretory pathway M-ring protein FliF/YscJ
VENVVQILGIMGGIFATLATIVTGWFTYKKYMRGVEERATERVRTQDEDRAQRLKEREDAFNDRVDKAMSDMQARCEDMATKYAELQGEHITTLHRLDTLERQRERDVTRIKELEEKVISLGGQI